METTQKNLAETLAEVLPKATLLGTIAPKEGGENLLIHHYAMPKGTEFKEIRTDLETLLAHPRATKAVAKFTDIASFLKYVERHAVDGSVTWCSFDPQTFALSFNTVFDEHVKEKAGWRSHRAEFKPDFSAEWKAWSGKNTKDMPQVEFAEWIQEHDEDINSSTQGLPTSLQMLTMATEFVANEERSLKSTARLQSGGVRLTYIADPDAGTTESMQLFEKFAIGIPVFQGGAAWALTARLKYRLNSGAVKFRYELVRPDRVHEGAAKELIEVIRAGLGAVPLLMGQCGAS